MRTFTKFLLTALLALTCNATTITVCASGCTYTTIQAGINAAVGGDIIEVKAGETFTEDLSIPYKAGSGTITLRTSRYKELPPVGTRVLESQAYLMPTVQPSSTTSQVLTFGPLEQYVNSVNTGTDVITYTGSHGYIDGDPIAFWHDDGSIPVVTNQVYFVRDKTSTTLKLANEPGGTAIDLTTTPTATRFRSSIARAPRNWIIIGINFTKKPTQLTEYTLIDIGTVEAATRLALPNNITLQHVLIHGVKDENGPRLCLFINGTNININDSRIYSCQKSGEEGKAIGFVQSPGPLTIRNNYIEAGAIDLLAGGDYVRIENLVNGDSGPIIIENNHFTKVFWTKYTAGTGGSGAPGGGCTPYTYYLNASSGQLYKCSGGGSWATAPTCTNDEYYRRTDVTQNCGSGACWKCSSGLFVTSSVYWGSGFNAKNLLEFKSIKNAIVRGNVFENNWVNSDQSGVAVWLISKVGQGNANGWVTGENIRFYNNIIRNSAQGIRIATEGGTTFGATNNHIDAYDNLLYKLGTTDYPSVDSDDSKPMSFAGPCNDCQFRNNTMVSGTTAGSAVVFDTAAMTRFYLANNIGNNNQYGITYDGGLSCTTYLPSPSQWYNSIFVNPDTSTWSTSSCASNVAGISNATTLFVGGGNYHLDATSPYSASCASGCAFTGTNGKDLGADIDAVNSATETAVSGGRGLNTKINITVGSTKALMSYTSPTASACTVKLYTDEARTTLHGDTDSGGEQTDARSGSITNGYERQFLFGTASALSASTTYWSTITCGTATALRRITTLPAGSGTYNYTIKYPTSVAGEYSSSASMTSPTSISSSTTHSVPVTTNTAVYYRRIGGLIRILLAR